MQLELQRNKEKARVGRRRINRERDVAVVLPVIEERASRFRVIIRGIWRALWWILEGPQIVRLRGPGLLPEESHEFINPDAQNALRRQGWL